MKTAYITHPDCLKHEMGQSHPECPQRLSAIESQLSSSGLMDKLQQHEAPKATIEQLERAHPKSFINNLIEKSPKQDYLSIDGDTTMNPFTLEAALRAAGAGILATDLVISGKVNSAFCNVRPPGHHAEQDRAMGFCFFNNIAVAALHAIQAHDIKRVAIVDFDVHHGNGTEDIVENHSGILFCSTFQSPFYPGYAGPSIKSKRVNIPLPSGTTGSAFREAVTAQWLPELREFKPEIIYVSAGFDGHAEDNMGGFNLSDDDYEWATQEIYEIADEFAQSRVVSMLEGGYDLASLSRSAAEHVKVLMNIQE